MSDYDEAAADQEERRDDAPASPEDSPADVEWEDTESSPHQGEEGQQPV